LKGSLLTLIVLAILTGAATVARNAQSTGESPAVIAAVAPATYPAVARQANAHGEVVIEVQVDAAGNVPSAKLISGHPLLRKVSEEAAKQWKFSPSQGGTKERVVRLTFGFQTVDASRNPMYEFTIVFLPPYKIDVQANGRIID
jgi:TonB family protein